MAVYEIKDPKPTPAVDTITPRRRDVKPVRPAEVVRPVDLLQLPGQRRGEDKSRWRKRDESEAARVEQSAKTHIRLINQQLEMLNVAIHLALFKDEDGYTLDVHDCRDGIVCEKVAQEPIDIDELPDLLERLKQQAGILLDRKL